MALKEGGIVPAEVSCSECHGTGTPLGDPIEVGAIQGVHQGRTKGAFGLTSSKSNLGHQEDTAGLMGIMMAHASCCSCGLHLRTLNPNTQSSGFPCLFTT